MTKTEIEEYLLKLEHKLLIESERHAIELTRKWANSFPSESAVYLFREDGEICYIGETGSLKGRMADILNTKNQTVRRNLGNSHFSELPNYEKASARKSFTDDIELLLNDLIINHLTMSYILVDLGRKELEERLFDKLKPKYSIKGKRGETKAYSKSEKQRKYKNAYERWAKEDDEQLELYFCEGKSISELIEIFGRNNGAINSRIEKLGLKEKYNM
ncbi:hypothetical protein SAMN04488519_106149 [Algoriphagus ornithinivorans]|uniref:GIY-YIG domain-containing protein n=1 Tax=Algoriphagus ornithinivorans TaxID=226506 RepID=A0A1I5GZ93_9BACT|nr:hypothetical protein [Algoriphagus ornithinivorans]SFO40911.1 hypothetical protein SAMN04488519_106149 [Algoriphagus ornithinivorans]